MKVCPTCDVEYPDTERFCPRDGTPLRSRDPTADLVGSVIAERYHVLQKLGEGGMGQVYLAEHVRMKRKSAVKVMHPSMTTDPDAISRFNREAANACQIQHSNVAGIYDFGETADGIVYIAMEYVEGESLARVLATQGALPPVRVADITRQVADGLDVAHRLGIVHRDLKPENILVGQHHDGRDLVKVVDFGISKGTGSGDSQAVTRSGVIVGTPDYMSPEQLAGEVLDQRSDVYSLGIVAFNMLTAKLPFQSKSAHTAMLMRLTDPPARLIETRPDIGWPLALQSVLDRAMDLDVARRFTTAVEFSAALTEAAGGVPAAPMSVARTVLTTGMYARESTPTLPPAAQTPSAQSPFAPSATPSPQSTSTTPPGFSFPIASGLSPAELSAIESKLAKAVGPIARILVKRAATSAPTRDALIATLAKEIDDDREREQFTKSFS